jgi:hypothetical protein
LCILLSDVLGLVYDAGSNKAKHNRN